MKIEAVDFFICPCPKSKTSLMGDKMLLVRVRAGGYEGWGECEAAPLPSIAGYVCLLMVFANR